MESRRILITGISTLWGGRLARALEADPAVETVIGIDRRPPKVPLERTEFVRVTDRHSLIKRIVEAAEIDTVVDTRLVTDSRVTSRRLAKENNVIGTMNVLAGCGGPGSPVRKLVFRSSAHWYGANQDDPGFLTEDHRRRHPPRSGIERDVVEAEKAVGDFAARNPECVVTVLRFASGLGPNLTTSTSELLALPVIPGILGFDPRLQLIHEDDIAGCLEHAVRNELPGTYNCAADGVLALSEVAGLLGKLYAPAIPPVGTGLAIKALRRTGVRIPTELVPLLRFGRGLDNRAMKAAGYTFRYTTREAVLEQRKAQRLASLVRGPSEPYRYEEEVEEFLRWSPSVKREASLAPRLSNVRPGEGRDGARTSSADPDELAGLNARELIALLPGMEPRALEALRAKEEDGPARRTVLQAIDAQLGRASSSAAGGG
jgi:UDP-glucose 4-epimerase